MLEKKSTPKVNIIVRFEGALSLHQGLEDTLKFVSNPNDWEVIAVEFKPHNLEDYGSKKES